MSTHAASPSSGMPAFSASASSAGAPAAGKALTIGVAGILLTALGMLFTDPSKIAFSWLVGITFWGGVALGMLLLVMLHHIFDASWSVVLRRQFEHGLVAFKWLGLLFLPLLVSVVLYPGSVWKWMDPHFDLSKVGGHGTVGSDELWVKKSGLLNPTMFIIITIASFAIWVWLSARLRRASFAQDADGDAKWTRKNRITSAFGIPVTAITLTLAIILWVKSLDYHWFSTMYGVWYFANCARAALSAGIIMMVWLWYRGDLKGILNDNHLYCIGMLMLTFTVFWGYVTFSQYFLIWNANVPEETFWYNLREINNSDGQPNQWKWVGMTLLFGHFFWPFCMLLSYKRKLNKVALPRLAVTIAAIILLDMIYNVWPSKKNALGDPLPFLSVHQIWTLTAVVGIGGICIWAYLKSFSTTKLIPIRDPRITECLTYHESSPD